MLEPSPPGLARFGKTRQPVANQLVHSRDHIAVPSVVCVKNGCYDIIVRFDKQMIFQDEILVMIPNPIETCQAHVYEFCNVNWNNKEIWMRAQELSNSRLHGIRKVRIDTDEPDKVLTRLIYHRRQRYGIEQLNEF